jgi:hypothetical protein
MCTRIQYIQTVYFIFSEILHERSTSGFYDLQFYDSSEHKVLKRSDTKTTPVMTAITVHKNISTKRNISSFSVLQKTWLQGNELHWTFCIMEPVVNQTNHVRLDSGGQTTISGTSLSNAIIICWSVRYSDTTLNKNYR